MPVNLPWLGAALLLAAVAYTFYVAAAVDNILDGGWDFTDGDE